MYKFILFVALAIFTCNVQAQAGWVKNKAKYKVNQRINQKVDKAMDEALDDIENSGKPAESSEPAQTPKTAEKEETAPEEVEVTSTENSGIKRYARYDFVPGEVIVYTNDFSADAIGELPIGWNSNGNGVVVTLSNQEGNWLQLYQNSMLLTDNTQEFSENFTVEFDMILVQENPKIGFPQLAFGCMASGDMSTTDNRLLSDYKREFAVELKVQPSNYNNSHLHLETLAANQRYLNTEIRNMTHLQDMFNQPIHVAMQVQKERLRVWFNEEKLYDLPKAIVPGKAINQFYFRVKTAGDESTGYTITNLKIAKGRPDSRHKLIEEGKFSTTGILFDQGSDQIKPESMGVLNEIGKVLKENPAVQITIVGHTNSDGDDQSNLALSKKRAQSVQAFLTEQWQIEAGRIETDGKGEAEPVADNNTREGKAQNRRVEFIKR